jgi:preprotein translocase subunit SecA
MTGTALTSAEEFDKVYGLEVIVVPTNKPMIRQDLPDRIYKTMEGKYRALVQEIKERHQKGQPLLIGTTSIEKNEYLGKLLEREGIPHQILNAKNHQKEGEIIAQAGRLGAVTIATNMAGRGVDIILGGNPPSFIEAEKVREVGGLHVIGTERHEARRIDNQLRGRAGRQGDPGSSQFFLSLEDDLMRVFGGEKVKNLMSILKIPEDQPIETKLVSRAIEEAQSKIEGFNFDLRKQVLEYDNVMNKQRELIYKKRKEFLRIENWQEEIEKWIKDEKEKELLSQKIKELGERFNEVVRFLVLRTIDSLWVNHLEYMDYLRDSVRLRAYGQQDPLVEYKNESYKAFRQLLNQLERMVFETLLKISVRPLESSLTQRVISPSFGNKKVGRNDPCPCGAKYEDGRPKKYKHCHGK